MAGVAGLNDLRHHAREIRRELLRLHHERRAGHLGSSLSIVDALAAIYGDAFRAGDELVLSKSHAATALYATLHRFGRLEAPLFDRALTDGSPLGAHLSPHSHPEIRYAAGSLGHGLSVAAGIALGQALRGAEGARTYCVLSDGELNCGSTWEAALFAAHHKLRNLVALIDVNGWQAFGATDEVLKMEPLREKWESFGFQVIELDGHDPDAIAQALRFLAIDPTEASSTRPACILARTIKGKGVAALEGRLESHYELIDRATLEDALKELT